MSRPEVNDDGQREKAWRYEDMWNALEGGGADWKEQGQRIKAQTEQEKCKDKAFLLFCLGRNTNECPLCPQGCEKVEWHRCQTCQQTLPNTGSHIRYHIASRHAAEYPTLRDYWEILIHPDFSRPPPVPLHPGPPTAVPEGNQKRTFLPGVSGPAGEWNLEPWALWMQNLEDREAREANASESWL